MMEMGDGWAGVEYRMEALGYGLDRLKFVSRSGQQIFSSANT